MIVLIRFPMSRIASHRITINDEKLQLLLDDRLLDRPRQVIPDLIRAKRRIQQERGTRLRRSENVHALQKLELVAGDEVGLA